MAEVTAAKTTIGSRLKAIVASLVIIAGIFGAVELLGIKAEANKLQGELAPMPVLTTWLERQNSYEVPATFTGTVEAGQQLSLSFQVSGEIETIMVEEGDRVSKGQALARLDTERLEATIAQLKADIAAREADLELSILTEERQKSLVDDGFTSKQRFDEARLGTFSANARLKAAKAALQSAQVDLNRSTLRAPFDGLIAARRSDAGFVSQVGTPTLDLIETGTTRARVGLPPELAREMNKGDVVTIQLGDRDIKATVIAVRPDIDPLTRSKSVLFSLEEQATALSYGDLVRLKLKRTIKEEGFWIPATALRAGERGLWLIYLVDGKSREGRVSPEAVEILYSNGTNAFVRGNIPAGARLVATGVQRVAPGQMVRTTELAVSDTVLSR